MRARRKLHGCQFRKVMLQREQDGRGTSREGARERGIDIERNGENEKRKKRKSVHTHTHGLRVSQYIMREFVIVP